MESGTNNNRLKIVWLCHFSNQEMKDFFNAPNVKEFAPWINVLIELFRKRSDVDLHIVAPNVYANKRLAVNLKNVNYHFYQYRPNLIPKKVHDILGIDSRTNFYFTKSKIARIIKNINPELIHLHGAENPYYSVAILPLIGRYPVLVTIQGFNENTSIRNHIINKRIKIEEKILKRAMHIGTRTKEMSEIALEFNPKAQLHFHNYPMTIPDCIKDNSKVSSYDIVYFARLRKSKGVEDLLKALSLVKKIKSNISLHIIGEGSKSYLRYLKNMAIQLDIYDNVKFIGYMNTQQDIYKHAVHAKMCVLPTYQDIIPGTILESMFMKLPVIAYAVGGIPELNAKGETVILVEKHNIQQLADSIMNLLQNENKRKSLAEFAYLHVIKNFDNTNVVKDMLKAYVDVIQIFNASK